MHCPLVVRLWPQAGAERSLVIYLGVSNEVYGISGCKDGLLKVFRPWLAAAAEEQRRQQEQLAAAAREERRAQRLDSRGFSDRREPRFGSSFGSRGDDRSNFRPGAAPNPTAILTLKSGLSATRVCCAFQHKPSELGMCR